MAKAKREDLGQGSMTGHSASPLEQRQQLEPMPPDEAEALDWALLRLHEKDPESSVRELVDDGIDEGIFLVDDAGLLRVSPELPEGWDDDEADSDQKVRLPKSAGR